MRAGPGRYEFRLVLPTMDHNLSSVEAAGEPHFG